MQQTGLVLRAYYEYLYDLLEGHREAVVGRIEALLAEQIGRLGPEQLEAEKFAAYLEAAVAFFDERLEMYNPIGHQYTFDPGRAAEAFELELQLNWYDARGEYEALVTAAGQLSSGELSDQGLRRAAAELAARAGAFPDGSILAGYEAEPALRKLPDYVLARAIEQVIAEQGAQ